MRKNKERKNVEVHATAAPTPTSEALCVPDGPQNKGPKQRVRVAAGDAKESNEGRYVSKSDVDDHRPVEVPGLVVPHHRVYRVADDAHVR